MEKLIFTRFQSQEIFLRPEDLFAAGKLSQLHICQEPRKTGCIFLKKEMWKCQDRDSIQISLLLEPPRGAGAPGQPAQSLALS